LNGFSGDDVVIYSTFKADYYFDRNELLTYYQDHRSGLALEHLNEFIEEQKAQRIVIHDTLGRVLDEGGSRRNDAHQYAHIQDGIGWTIIEFARKGNLKIYSHMTNEFLSEITFFETEDNLAGTSGLCQSDSVLIEELRWIK